MVRRRTALAAAVAAPLGAAFGAGRGGSAVAAPSLHASRDVARTALFGRYADSGVGWTGADSTYSVRLPDGRVVWIFSDTFLGPVEPDGSRPKDAPFLNNSFVVQRGPRLSTVHGGTADAPAALLPPDADGWYWAGAGMLGDGTLDVTYHQFHRTGDGPLDFAWRRDVLARFDLRTLAVRDVTPLPSAVPNVQSASWLTRLGGYTLIYRVEDTGPDKYLHLARVRGADLRGRWEYRTATGWSRDETASARLLRGVSNEYSVTRVAGRWLLVTQDTTELLGPHLVGYWADSPLGPFGGKTPIWTAPEAGADGSYRNANVYAYNPHAHPELAAGGGFVVSYNVNSLDTDDVYEDVTIYRPRFLIVR